MKKILTACSVLFLGTYFLCAVEVPETKSIKALKMDKFPEGALGTMEIQLEVKKILLSEVDSTPDPVPTAEDNQNGYILFFRNYQSIVYPFTKPVKAETAKKEIKIFASLGEFEPITFSVYPLTKLSNCRLSVSDFVNENGAKIGKEAFHINSVMNCPIGISLIVVRSYLLIPAKEVPLIEKNVCKQIWINVKVPEDAKEGTYKGSVTFAPAGKPATNIPVEIKVMPFKLMQPPDVTWAPCWGEGCWEFDKLEKRLIMMKEHGMTGEAIDGGLAPEGKDYNDFTKANKYMDMARKVGLTGKFILINLHVQGFTSYDKTPGPFGTRGDSLFCQQTYDKVEDVIRKTRDNAEKNKWLPYAFYLTTELGSTDQAGKESFNKAMSKAPEYYAAARKVERVKLMASFNRQPEFIMHWNLPALDEIGMNGDMFPEWEKAAKIKPSWICFFGISERCGEGFYTWKWNIKGNRPWFGGEDIAVPNAAENIMKSFKNEFYPTTMFEKIREGVDDYKYCYTLSEYIKQAKAKGKDVSAAEKSLQRVMDKIPYSHKKDPKDYDYTKLDDFRWELAQQIVKLMK